MFLRKCIEMAERKMEENLNSCWRIMMNSQRVSAPEMSRSTSEPEKARPLTRPFGLREVPPPAPADWREAGGAAGAAGSCSPCPCQGWGGGCVRAPASPGPCTGLAAQSSARSAPFSAALGRRRKDPAEPPLASGARGTRAGRSGRGGSFCGGPVFETF